MIDASCLRLAQLADREHDLLIACHHAAERATRRAYLSPVTGIILAEMRRFHAFLLAELEDLVALPAIAVLVEDHHFLDLRILGLTARYERGDELAQDLDELVGDWYRLHAIRHAWAEQAMAVTPT